MKSLGRCGEAFAISRGFRGPRPPKRPAPWTGLGIALHDAFQKWEELDREGDVISLFETAYDDWVEESLQKQPNLDLWVLPPNTKSTKNGIANYRKRGVEKDVPLYRDRCLEAEWEILRMADGSKALELEFELLFENHNGFGNKIPVKGYIDRLLYYPSLDRVVVEDLKTGSPDDDLDYRQLDLYSLAAKEIYNVNLTHGRYWYTKLDRPGEWRELNKTREHLEEAYNVTDQIIYDQLFLARPGKHCGLCEVRPFCGEVGWLQPGDELSSENVGG
jgi:hypothetical protein